MLSSITSVVPTEITVFPKTSLILALAALDSKLINSSTLQLSPDSKTLTVVIPDLVIESISSTTFESVAVSKKG